MCDISQRPSFELQYFAISRGAFFTETFPDQFAVCFTESVQVLPGTSETSIKVRKDLILLCILQKLSDLLVRESVAFIVWIYSLCHHA